MECVIRTIVMVRAKVMRFVNAFCNGLSCLSATFLPMYGNKYNFRNSVLTFSEFWTFSDGILAHFKPKPDN